MSNKNFVSPIVFKLYVSHRYLVRQKPSQHVHIIWHTCCSIDEVSLKWARHAYTLKQCVQSLWHFQIIQALKAVVQLFQRTLLMLRTIRGDQGCIPLSLCRVREWFSRFLSHMLTFNKWSGDLNPFSLLPRIWHITCPCRHKDINS